MVKLKKIYIIVFIILLNQNTFANSEKNSFSEIKKNYNSKNLKQQKYKSRLFFKKYPKSRYVVEIHLLSALSEKDPEKRLAKLKKIIRLYKYYKKMDLVVLNICQTYNLLGQWKGLEVYSQMGLLKFKKSKYRNDFLHYKSLALVNIQNYNQMGDVNRAKGIDIEKSYINYRVNGNINSYYSTLKKESLKKGNNSPRALYLFAEDQLERKKYNNAYSAYRDIAYKFKRSPEALLAEKRIKQIKKFKPLYSKNFFKIKSSSNKSSKSFPDISPDMEAPTDDKKNSISYTVSVGPFYNLKTAIKLKKNLLKQFKPVYIVKLKKKFILNVGDSPTLRGAKFYKIRLAEEYSLKGHIINMKTEKSKIYIYE